MEGCQLPTVLDSQQWNKASSSLSTPRTLNFIALARRRNDALFEILTIGSKWKLVQTLLSTSPNIIGAKPLNPQGLYYFTWNVSAVTLILCGPSSQWEIWEIWMKLVKSVWLSIIISYCDFFFHQTSTKTTSWWETYLFEKEKAKSLEGLGKHENTGAV